ncbi:MAG TPA: Gfo/Idh/MocA family oxidoreductase [Tepidisphaeraceae bacterium]|jgi:predicted dehydrogenase
MSFDWTRRDFIQRAAAFSAAMAAAQAAFAQQEKKEGDKPKEKKKDKEKVEKPKPNPKNAQLRVAFVGVGGKGNHNLHALAECGVTVAALCDIDSKFLEKAAAEFPNAKKYVDFRQMMEKDNKEFDAVCISTPDHTHAPAAMLAMHFNKHVYCEKPLTHNIAEARLLTETARKSKVVTQMGNQGHSAEGSEEQVQWVKSGVIGPVKEVHVWTDRPIWPQGMPMPKDTGSAPEAINWDLWLGPAPERPYSSAYHPFKWRGYWDFGTGALGDMACHIMDTAVWSLNLTNPTSVEAFSEGKTDVSGPLWSVIRYEFPQRGELPPVKMFWYDGRLMPPTKYGSSDKLGDNGAIFVGDKGTIAAKYTQRPVILEEKLAKEYKPATQPTTRPGGFDHHHHLEWVEACVGSGKKPGSNFDYAGPLTETVLLGNFAVRMGRRIEWDAKNMKCTNVPEANQYVTREYRKGFELIT